MKLHYISLARDTVIGVSLDIIKFNPNTTTQSLSVQTGLAIILFVGIYGFIIALRKIAYLRKISKVDTTEIFGVVTASMERGGAVEALKQINGFKNPISRIISETLKIGYKNKTEVEESMEQIFIVEVGKMTKGLNTIKTITELAPFLGLIGTVIGIWLTFKSLGVNPNTAAMAEGIYVSESDDVVIDGNTISSTSNGAAYGVATDQLSNAVIANNKIDACVCLNPCIDIIGMPACTQCLASISFIVEL